MSLRINLSVVVLAAAVFVGGCAGTGDKDKNGDKNAATAQWRAARASVLITLARDQFSSGNFDEARNTMTDAIKLLPDNAELRTLSGRIAFEQGDLELAESELRHAQKSDPKFAPADYYLGVIMQRWQRYPDALALYTAASEKAPNDVAYVLARSETLIALDRDQESLAVLNQAMKKFENSAEVRSSIAQLLMRQRKFPEAAEMMRQAVMLAPDDETLREHLAMCYFRAERYEEAVEAFQRLLRIEKLKDRSDLHTRLGECYLALGRPMDARGAFEAASVLEPGNVGFQLNLAKSALESGDLRRAEITVRKALALAPTDAQANLLMGYVRMEQSKLPEALAAFRRAAVADSRDPTPLCMAGVVLEKLGRREEAMQQYAKALTIKPNDELAKSLMNQIEATAGIGGDR